MDTELAQKAIETGDISYFLLFGLIVVGTFGFYMFKRLMNQSDKANEQVYTAMATSNKLALDVGSQASDIAVLKNIYDDLDNKVTRVLELSQTNNTGLAEINKLIGEIKVELAIAREKLSQRRHND